jgi:hypothetical protein
MRSGWLAAVALILWSPSVRAADLPARASFAGLKSIGRLVVAVPVTADEVAVRELMERGLEHARITLDPSLDTELEATILVSRDSGPSGQKHCLYLITLAFHEPVRTRRTPATTYRATSWSSTATVQRFSGDIPIQTVLDAVENKMGVFLATVAADASTVDGRRGE